MKMRTARTAGLVGGLATGALLLAGSAAQAAESGMEESTDLVAATPEAFGGLPVAPDQVTDAVGGVASQVPGLNALPVDAVPGLNALPVDAVPGLDALAPAGPAAEAQTGTPLDAVTGQLPVQDGNPLTDLLSGLGGGLPVPLPF